MSARHASLAGRDKVCMQGADTGPYKPFCSVCVCLQCLACVCGRDPAYFHFLLRHLDALHTVRPSIVGCLLPRLALRLL
jgi:hypothetical protein